MFYFVNKTETEKFCQNILYEKDLTRIVQNHKFFANSYKLKIKALLQMIGVIFKSRLWVDFFD